MKKIIIIFFIIINGLIFSEKEFYRNGNIKYEGEIKNEVYEGKGKYYYPEGSKAYEGEFSNGKFNGKGRYFNRKGNIIYDGNFKDDYFDGIGKGMFDSGEINEGEFKKGVFINGKVTGAINYSGLERDGQYYKTFYSGYNKDGKKSGNSKIVMEDGTVIYDGNYENGEKSGYGKSYGFHYGNEKIILEYEGYYKNGKYNGKGKSYSFNTGKPKYEGEFYKNNIKEGKEYDDNGNLCYDGSYRLEKATFGGFYSEKLRGKEYDKNGIIIYEGEYSKEKNRKYFGKLYKNGKLYFDGYLNNIERELIYGKLYYPNGNIKYEGEFNYKEEPNGRGTLYGTKGEKVTGIFNRGEYVK